MRGRIGQNTCCKCTYGYAFKHDYARWKWKCNCFFYILNEMLDTHDNDKINTDKYLCIYQFVLSICTVCIYLLTFLKCSDLWLFYGPGTFGKYLLLYLMFIKINP